MFWSIQNFSDAFQSFISKKYKTIENIYECEKILKVLKIKNNIISIQFIPLNHQCNMLFLHACKVNNF